MVRVAPILSRSNLVFSVLAIILGLSALTAYDQLSAYITFSKMTNEFNEFGIEYAQDTPPDAIVLDDLVSEGYAASQRSPDNALYKDNLATALLWRVYFFDEHSPSDLLAAKQALLEAVQLRPLWPMTWVNLASVKLRLNEIDDELYFYLDNANKFGRNHFDVNVFFSDMGMRWYQARHTLYTKYVKDIHFHIDKSLRTGFIAKEVRSMIMQRGLQENVCRWLNKKRFKC